MQKYEPFIDSFGRQHTYLRLSVTDRCNLRCIYCMPSNGILLKKKEEILSFDEIERLVRIVACSGIVKVRITGGEPLIRKDVPSLIKRIASVEGIRQIGITTNGVLLKQYLPSLLAAGVTSFNISLDTLQKERFRSITLQDEFAAVMGSIDAILKVGVPQVKLNVVVMGGVNDGEIKDFIEFARYRSITVRFIEYMPFKNTDWKPTALVTYAEMMHRIEERYKLIPLTNTVSDSAKLFQIPGWVGKIGFITPMSDPFCSSCNRLRITADGNVKSCLFISEKMNLRSVLRNGTTDEAIAALLRQILANKPREHASLDEICSTNNQSMSQIGG
jgi:molybdenum cofactor biosynthesis protein A